MDLIKRRIELNPFWLKASGFLFVMFFIFLADAAIADFVPGFLQENLGNPLLMGIVMSTSSVAGFLLDLSFAKFFRATTLKSMIGFSIIGFILFCLILITSTYYPFILLFLLAMVIWGFYYEFFGFASQKFVVSIASSGERTAVWSVLETTRALAYATGPLLMIYMGSWGNRNVLLACILISIIAFLFFLVTRIKERVEREVPHSDLLILRELVHWKDLFVHIWPMVILGLILGIVDATFWTTGTIVNDLLAKESKIGRFFLTAYMCSPLLVGLIMGRMEIKSGKKKLSEILILASGLGLTMMTFFNTAWWYVLVVFVSSLMSALAWPLIDATYTDLLARMGRHQAHMVGLKNASYSLAYIIGPILSGGIAMMVGEIKSFVYLGYLLIAVATILLLTTPNKLKLPQNKISTWE